MRRSSSLREFLNHTVRPIWSKANDVYLNIDTTGPALTSANSIGGDGERSQSVEWTYARQLLRELRLSPSDVLFDLGCGRGRMLCLASRFRLQLCVGIELIPEICEIAKKNAARVHGRQAPVEVICGDCATTDLSAGSVYLMFNPFGAATMRAVLTNIEASLQAHPRKIRIGYLNPVHEKELKNCGFLSKTLEFRTFFGGYVNVWGNCV